MSNSLDPGQARHFVRPDLGPNSLQMLHVSADGKVPSRIKQLLFGNLIFSYLAVNDICFLLSHLLIYVDIANIANNIDPDQTAP